VIEEEYYGLFRRAIYSFGKIFLGVRNKICIKKIKNDVLSEIPSRSCKYPPLIPSPPFTRQLRHVRLQNRLLEIAICDLCTISHLKSPRISYTALDLSSLLALSIPSQPLSLALSIEDFPFYPLLI
jgi:hypothetical protein